MADEEPMVEEEAPKVEEPPVVLDPKKRETHPAVMAILGHSCSVEGCDYIFGDRQYGVEPHPIQPIIPKSIPLVGPTPPPPPPPAAPSDPGVCQNAIQIGNDCPACGWKRDSTEPHPIRL